MAYQHFLRASGIDPSQLNPKLEEEDDDEALATGEEQYNGDLAHFSKQENCKKVRVGQLYCLRCGGGKVKGPVEGKLPCWR